MRCGLPILALAMAISALLPGSASANKPDGPPLTFRRAVELAAQHSLAVATASAVQQRAYQAYLETKGQAAPQVLVGSPLGYSAGFPLTLEDTAPSLLNLTAGQSLFQPARRSYEASAQALWQVSVLQKEQQRKHAALDAALAYTELSQTNWELQVLERQQQAADRLVRIEGERVSAGLDAPLQVTRAKLTAARARLRFLDLTNTALQLRRHLADVTGLPEREIEPVTDSIPLPPESIPPAGADNAASSNNLQVRIAAERAHAAQLQAQGDHLLRWPTLDLGERYAVLSRWNHYDEFFKKFRQNNDTFGAIARLDVFDPAREAHARKSDAEAVVAERQTEVIQSQVAAQAREWQATVKQLSLARDVVQLEYSMVRDNAIRTGTRAEFRGATAPDAVSAEVAQQEKFAALVAATFDLQKARLQMLAAMDGLESWLAQPASTEQSGIPQTASSQPHERPLQTLMLVPGTVVMSVGDSRRLFAIAVYNDGSAMDVSSQTTWSCSCNWNAIVSTSGLVTALNAQQVMVTATLSGVTQSRAITITAGNSVH